MRKSIVTVILLASAASAFAQTSAPSPTLAKAAKGPVAAKDANKPQIGDFGFDMAGRDTSVTPGTDFFDYANGGWVKTTPIPADRSSYGMFHVLQDLSLERTRTILDVSAKTPGDKVGDFYSSFMDEAAVNAKGATPVKPMLAALKATKDKTALVTEIAKLQRQGVGGFVGVGVQQDDKDPTTYVVSLGQSGIGLPDRDYYLKDDAKLATIRTAYEAYLTRMLTLAGEPNAAARAAAVFNLEKGLATAHWTRIESRDADKTYNKWTAADFAAKAPGFPWAQYMTAMGVTGRPFYLVAQPSAVTGEAKVFADTPINVLQDYAMLKVLRAYAPYLSSDFDKTNFAFYGTTLSGTPEQRGAVEREVGLVEIARQVRRVRTQHLEHRIV
ncbi:MAG: M13 family peptidase, partial [Sphingomonas sp.]